MVEHMWHKFLANFCAFVLITTFPDYGACFSGLVILLSDENLRSVFIIEFIFFQNQLPTTRPNCLPKLDENLVHSSMRLRQLTYRAPNKRMHLAVKDRPTCLLHTSLQFGISSLAFAASLTNIFKST